jgi:hypothetical protein
VSSRKENSVTANTIRTHPRQGANRDPIGADLARNAALLAVLWVAYVIVRDITAGDLAAMTENAQAIVDLRMDLGLPSEGALRGALLDDPGSSEELISTTWAFIPHHRGILGIGLRSGRSKFARARNALIVTASAGLEIHVIYPLKPPGRMAGLVDTAAVIGPDPHELGISGGASQTGGHPLLHVGWACSWHCCIERSARRPTRVSR